MKLRVALMLLTASNTLVTSAAWSVDFIAEGIKAFRSGDYPRAEEIYRDALAIETNRQQVAAIYRNLAILYNAQGKDGSQFTKKADELDPPVKAKTIRQADGSELMINSQTDSGLSRQVQEEEGLLKPGGLKFTRTEGPDRQAAFNQGNYSNQSGLTGKYSKFPAGSNLEPVYPSSPAFAGGVFRSRQASGGLSPGSQGIHGLPGAGTGSSLRPGAIPAPYRFAPGAFGLGPLIYSQSTPNSNFQYSTGTPIVLPNANGSPVIINAPGPNVESTQLSPDGSATTIIKRTY